LNGKLGIHYISIYGKASEIKSDIFSAIYSIVTFSSVWLSKSNASDSCFNSELLYETKGTKGSMTSKYSLITDTNFWSLLGSLVISRISSMSAASEACSLILSSS